MCDVPIPVYQMYRFRYIRCTDSGISDVPIPVYHGYKFNSFNTD